VITFGNAENEANEVANADPNRRPGLIPDANIVDEIHSIMFETKRYCLVNSIEEEQELLLNKLLNHSEFVKE
jgi:hypothetical protein